MSRIGRGPGAGRRWGSALGAVAVLVALPPTISRLPVRVTEVVPATLLARVADSADVPHSGYAESAGRVSFPKTRYVDEALDPLAQTTKLRVWWSSRSLWRIDEVTAVGERGLYRDEDGTVAWDSSERQATRVAGEFPVRLPRAADLTPPELGRRLASPARPEETSALPAKRVAGVAAVGVRITPGQPEVRIGWIDLWADPRTGLPLDVRVYEDGGRTPVLSSRFLDLEVGPPDAGAVRFRPPADVGVDFDRAPDLAALLDRYTLAVLPDEVAGQRRRGSEARAGGTYGEGYALVGAIALPERLGRRVYRGLRDAGGLEIDESWGSAVYVRLPLLSGLVVRDNGGDSWWALAGAVDRGSLERLGAALAEGQAGP